MHSISSMDCPGIFTNFIPTLPPFFTSFLSIFREEGANVKERRKSTKGQNENEKREKRRFVARFTTFESELATVG